MQQRRRRKRRSLSQQQSEPDRVASFPSQISSLDTPLSFMNNPPINMTRKLLPHYLASALGSGVLVHNNVVPESSLLTLHVLFTPNLCVQLRFQRIWLTSELSFYKTQMLLYCWRLYPKLSCGLTCMCTWMHAELYQDQILYIVLLSFPSPPLWTASVPEHCDHNICEDRLFSFLASTNRNKSFVIC